MEPETESRLAAAAVEAMKAAYAPYSNFHVGAALLARSGRIYSGCNVENASFGATICAERAACATAVAAGERTFDAIAVATAANPPAPPCGICRQFLSEFGTDLEVLLVNIDGKTVKTSLKELLPVTFQLRRR